MCTNSNLPFRVFTTFTQDPKGRFGWAAVRLSESNFSPLAVVFPLNSVPYQLALPTHTLMGRAGSLKRATKGASITGAIRNIKGIQRIAAQAKKSGRLIVCSFGYEYLKSVANLPHYVNQFLLLFYFVAH